MFPVTSRSVGSSMDTASSRCFTHYARTHARTHNHHRHIWGFDSFAGHPPQTAADRSTSSAEALSDNWRVRELDVWRTLELGTESSRQELEQRVTLVPGWFHETMPTFRRTLALVHLDPDYYQSTKDVLTYLWPAVAKNGVVLCGQRNNPMLPGKGVALTEFLASMSPDEVASSTDQLSGHFLLTKLRSSDYSPER